MASPRKLRWGVLSTADIARRKVIAGIRHGTRGEVVAIASRDAASARRVAAELGFARAHGSYESLLADPDVDAEEAIPLDRGGHPDRLAAE